MEPTLDPDNDPIFAVLPSRNHTEAILIACVDLGFVPPLPLAADERDPNRVDPDSPDLSPAAAAIRDAWATTREWTWIALTTTEHPDGKNGWQRSVRVSELDPVDHTEKLVRRNALILRQQTAGAPDAWAWSIDSHAWHVCRTAYACMDAVNTRVRRWHGAA